MSPVDQLNQRIQEANGVSNDDLSRRERIDITKTALREVINEWLDDRWKQVGKWTVRGIAVAAFSALIYFILTGGGWSHK